MAQEIRCGKCGGPLANDYICQRCGFGREFETTGDRYEAHIQEHDRRIGDATVEIFAKWGTNQHSETPDLTSRWDACIRSATLGIDMIDAAAQKRTGGEA